MALRLTAILLICSVSCILAQYNNEDGTSQPALPKKPLLPKRRIATSPSARLASANPPQPPQTNVITQRFRRPIPLNKPRISTAEPVPELPVFTSGIRGSRPSSSVPINYAEQNDEPSSGPVPIQTIQQPAIVYAQPATASSTLQPPELRPVSEIHEKDEDVVQVIANLGQVSNYQGNLLTPTAAPPTPLSPTIGAYLVQQHERQRQEERLERQRQDDAREIQRQAEHLERQRQDDARERLRQEERLVRQRQEQQQRIQEERSRPEHQQIIQPVQYRPAVPLTISRTTPQTFVPENQAIHQVIAPVQYRPQKPPRLPKKQAQQQQQQQQQSQRQDQQQLVDRNEFEFSDARPVVKQRAQVVPKKTKPQGDYYEGRTKKPVAQVIRRYREETADGSIIWGFENDDGSFKEEIIGVDCITRGKYGYVDPDGVRREYTYETGIKCDEEAQQQQDQDILNTFVDYQENKLVLPSGKTIDLSSMGKKQARRPQPLYRN